MQAVSRRTPKVAEPVGGEELKDAILAMIVEKFGDRTLDWQTVEHALSLVNFEVKRAALAERGRPWVRKIAAQVGVDPSTVQRIGRPVTAAASRRPGRSSSIL